MVTRTEGWPERLAAVIELAAMRPFSWADHNCGSFVADCMQAMTGVDPAGDLRGWLTNEAEAREALAGMNARGGSVSDFARRIAREWAAEPVLPAYAQRGDVAVVRSGKAAVLGIIWGGRIVVVTPEDGLGRLPMSDARQVWRVAG